MADAGEVKARVTIEYDGSGLQQAKSDLEELAGLAGSFGGEGGIGDAVAAMGDSFAQGTKESEAFTEALGDGEEALKTNEEAVSSLNDTLGEHQQVAQDAASAQEIFSGQVEETAKQLKEVPTSLQEVTKSTQAMSEQVAKSGDTIASLSDNMTNLAYANEGVASWWSDTMLAATEKSYSLLEPVAPTDFVPETLWSAGEQAKTVSDGFTSIATSSEQANKAVTDFLGNDSAQYFADIVPSAEDANKAVSEFLGTTEDVNKTAEKTGGIFSDIFGEGGAFSGLGGALGDIGGVFGGMLMGLNEVAMPLFALQMLGSMASGVGSYIYNANLAAEGPNASSPSSFTSQVDQLTKGMQDAGNSFAVGVGTGLLPFLNAQNSATQNPSGTDFWKGLGEGVGGALGGLGDVAQIVGGSVLGAIGVGTSGSLDLSSNPLSIQGYNMATTGAHGLANLWAQITGQPLPYASTSGMGTMPWNAGLAPYLNADTSNVTAGGDNYLTNPLSPYYGMNASTAQAAWNQSHYTGTTGPSDPANAYWHAIAMRMSGDSNYPVPAVTPDIAANELYFNSMPTGSPTSAAIPTANGLAYGDTITQQQINDQQFQQQPGWVKAIENFKSDFGQMWSDASASQMQSGQPGVEGLNFSSIGQGVMGGLSNAGSFLWNITGGGIGQSLNDIGSWFSGLFGGGGQASIGCFVAGTRVLLADGTEKPIEQLQEGERILASNGIEHVTTTVQKRIVPPARLVYALHFSDGTTLTTTDSHPLHSPLQGWKALSPVNARRENPDLPISLLQWGDTITTVRGAATLVAIEKQGIAPIYNIEVGEPHTFYANGVLAHNKVGAMSADLGQNSGFQMPHFDMSGVASSIGSAVSSMQLPHLDLGGMASSIGGAFSGIQLPHLDLGGIASGLGGAFSGIQLPHLDLGGMTSSLGGAFSGIQLPHLDMSGIASSLGGAFSSIQLPHLDLSGIGSSLSGAFSNISLPSIPNIAGQLSGELSGMFSGFSLPSIPNIAGQISGELSGMFSGFSLPSIPNIAGEINSTVSNMFSGFSLPSIPNIAGAINSTIGNMFSNFSLPSIPNIAGMINSTISNMFSGIMIPGFASGVEGFSGGLAMVGEAGPELVVLPGGSSVYPMTSGAPIGGSGSPISLGSSGGGGSAPQSINLVVQLDSQALISALGLPLSQSIRVGMGLRSY